MIKRACCVVALAAGMVISSAANATVTSFASKTITLVEADDTDDCVYFQLDGVTEANPVHPGQPWFAVSLSSLGGKNLVTFLLSARLSGTPLSRVVADGSLVCGTVQAFIVDL